MKQLYTLIFLILLFFTIKVNAQLCVDKNIKTGPSNSYPVGTVAPVNLEQPSSANFFNWMLNPPADGITFRFDAKNGIVKSLRSPWHAAWDRDNDYMNLALGTNSDYLPVNGWELFKVNLGRLSDNTTKRQGAPLVPYIMMYNRYTSILRVFAHLDRTNDYKTIQIGLDYDDPRPTTANGRHFTALLSLHQEVQQPLDQPTETYQVHAMAKSPNSSDMFF